MEREKRGGENSNKTSIVLFSKSSLFAECGLRYNWFPSIGSPLSLPPHPRFLCFVIWKIVDAAQKQISIYHRKRRKFLVPIEIRKRGDGFLSKGGWQTIILIGLSRSFHH